MDIFCISSSILGSERHLVISENGFSTLSPDDSSLQNMWFINGIIDSTNSTKMLCLDSLFKLYGVEILLKPSIQWVKSLNLVAKDIINIPWSQIMPTQSYHDFVKKLIKTIVDAMDQIPKDYYMNTWREESQLFCSLKAAKIDVLQYNKISKDISYDSGAFETFRPNSNGRIPVVSYNRFATRTGRLIVESGPNILTLKKEYRQLLKSSFSSGTICSLDFGALEVRIILAEAGKNISSRDLYLEIANELFGGKISRDVVKIAIISELYGSSKNMIGLRLGLEGKKLDEFINLIKSNFKTIDLCQKLKDEYCKTGKIKNFYGRLLKIDDPKNHVLINTYAQSTGVDVSLLGFKKIVDDLGFDGIRPLFILHDALILDVRSDRLDDVKNILSVKVPGYNNEFPIKFEEISCC